MGIDFGQITADAGMDLFGKPCVYTGTAGATSEPLVIIEKNVEIMSAYGTQMPAHRDIASLKKSQIPDPKRGHTITVGGETHTVDQLQSDDGHIVRVLLR